MTRREQRLARFRKAWGRDDLRKSDGVARGGRYVYRVKKGKGWHYVYPEDLQHHARPHGEPEPQTHRHEHGDLREDLKADELARMGAKMGGARLDRESHDSKGNPILVPVRDPHHEWNALREKISARIGNVGDHPDALAREGDWKNAEASTPAELVKLAEATAPHYMDWCRGIAKSVPAAAAYAGEGDKYATKTLESLTRKVTSKAERLIDRGSFTDHAAAVAHVVNDQIGDCLRASLLVDHAEDVGKIVASMRTHAKAIGGDVLVENKWTNSERGAYCAVHAWVQFPTPDGGHMQAELQIHPRALLGAKEKMHLIYDVTRENDFKGDQRAYDWSSKLTFAAGMARVAGSEHPHTRNRREANVHHADRADLHGYHAEESAHPDDRALHAKAAELHAKAAGLASNLHGEGHAAAEAAAFKARAAGQVASHVPEHRAAAAEHEKAGQGAGHQEAMAAHQEAMSAHLAGAENAAGLSARAKAMSAALHSRDHDTAHKYGVYNHERTADHHDEAGIKLKGREARAHRDAAQAHRAAAQAHKRGDGRAGSLSRAAIGATVRTARHIGG